MGCAIAPIGALVNHSCEPNVVIVFPRSGPKKDEPNLQVIAIREIQIGEEVCNTCLTVIHWGASNVLTVVQLFGAYVDITLPREERRDALKTTYDFICNCSECSRPPTSVDTRSAVVCPNRCGGSCAVVKGR